MTAQLTYQIILTLSENEREKLFDMLQPHYQEFNVDDFINEEIEIGYTDEQLTNYLIQTLFSKHDKTSKQ